MGAGAEIGGDVRAADAAGARGHLCARCSDDTTQLATTSGALACLWSAGALSWRALVAEARYFLGERTDPPKLPLKLFGTILTAVGAGLAAMAGGHTLVGAGVFGLLAGLGYALFFGRDVRPKRVQVAVVEGIDTAAVVIGRY